MNNESEHSSLRILVSDEIVNDLSEKSLQSFSLNLLNNCGIQFSLQTIDTDTEFTTA